MQHDDLCHAAALGGWHDPECCDCNLIAKVRADERERLASQAATVTVTRGDDGDLTFTADDPNGVGWVPVDLALIPQMAAQSRAVFDLRQRVAEWRAAAVEASLQRDGAAVYLGQRIEGQIWAYERVLHLLDGADDA